MKKIIWVDIGTHLGQEYQSVFSGNAWILIRLLRHFVGTKIMRRGKYSVNKNLQDFLSTRSAIKSLRNSFKIIFIEPNFLLTQNRIYQNADYVFNIALSDLNNDSYLNLKKLYFPNGNHHSQGSSIYINKKGATVDNYRYCLTANSYAFVCELKKIIEEEYVDYQVILRMNCEGAEDSIIYDFKKVFDVKFTTIFGSLKDVKEIKGSYAYETLLQFIRNNKLQYFPFSSEIESWASAHTELLKVLKSKNYD